MGAELYQLCTADVFGTPKGQQAAPTTLIYMVEHPIYFYRLTERIYIESQEDWYDFDSFVPTKKMKGDKVVGAVMPNHATGELMPLIGTEYDAMKQTAKEFKERKHRVTDVPVIEEVPVEVFITKTVPYYPPFLVTAAIWIGMIAAILGALT